MSLRRQKRSRKNQETERKRRKKFIQIGCVRSKRSGFERQRASFFFFFSLFFPPSQIMNTNLGLHLTGTFVVLTSCSVAPLLQQFDLCRHRLHRCSGRSASAETELKLLAFDLCNLSQRILGRGEVTCVAHLSLVDKLYGMFKVCIFLVLLALFFF